MQAETQMMIGQAPLQTRIDAYFAGLGQGVNANSLKRARLAQIIQMEQKSDLDLALMGLRREDILPFVFRDLLAA